MIEELTRGDCFRAPGKNRLLTVISILYDSTYALMDQSFTVIHSDFTLDSLINFLNAEKYEFVFETKIVVDG